MKNEQKSSLPKKNPLQKSKSATSDTDWDLWLFWDASYPFSKLQKSKIFLPEPKPSIFKKFENYQEIAILWLESVDGDSESSNKVREDFEPEIGENQKLNSILFDFIQFSCFVQFYLISQKFVTVFWGNGMKLNEFNKFFILLLLLLFKKIFSQQKKIQIHEHFPHFFYFLNISKFSEFNLRFLDR